MIDYRMSIAHSFSQNGTRNSLETMEMSKSCWSLPSEAGSAGEEAAALQAILNGYLAAVPKRIVEAEENFVERCVCLIY